MPASSALGTRRQFVLLDAPYLPFGCLEQLAAFLGQCQAFPVEHRGSFQAQVATLQLGYHFLKTYLRLFISKFDGHATSLPC